MNTSLSASITSVLDRTVIDTLERRTARIVLMSPLIEEVRTAIRLISCSVMESLGRVVVNYVLRQGDEDIIRVIAAEPCFQFPRYAQLAFTTGVMRCSRLPMHVLALLIRMNDDGMLRLDFPRTIETAIRSGNHEAVMLLCARPEAMLPEYGEVYLLDCIYDGFVQLDTLLFLLDQRKVNVDQGIVDDFMWGCAFPGDNTGLYDSLLVHPRTRQYVLENERQRIEREEYAAEQLMTPEQYAEDPLSDDA